MRSCVCHSKTRRLYARHRCCARRKPDCCAASRIHSGGTCCSPPDPTGLNTTSSTAACLRRSLGQSSTGHAIISANSLPRGRNRERSVGMSAFGGIPLLRRYSRHCSADHFGLDVQAMRFFCEHYSLLRWFGSATISSRSRPRKCVSPAWRLVPVVHRGTLTTWSAHSKAGAAARGGLFWTPIKGAFCAPIDTQRSPTCLRLHSWFHLFLPGFRAKTDDIEAAAVRVPRRPRHSVLVVFATSSHAYAVGVLAALLLTSGHPAR